MPSSLQLFAITTIVCAVSATGFSAGTDATEEAAIRKLIAAADNASMPPPLMSDAVFWSGAYKKPTVGKEKGESTSNEKRVPGSQKVQTQPLRIVFADSRDLAYEHSKFTLEFTTEAGKHVKFDGGLLRVWQKENGEWKQAAAFMRPYVEQQVTTPENPVLTRLNSLRLAPEYGHSEAGNVLARPFQAAHLQRLNPVQANLSEAILPGAILTGADPSYATLNSAILVRTNLATTIHQGIPLAQPWQDVPNNGLADRLAQASTP